MKNMVENCLNGLDTLIKVGSIGKKGWSASGNMKSIEDEKSKINECT